MLRQQLVISLAAPTLVNWLGAVNPDAGPINRPLITAPSNPSFALD